ncbi:MAG TPA: hypothetical protein VG325_14630 [Solirubrobacteraceae bacterium]|nr:hypothetical protein [Solirubrobacteraceae bacterium]
MAVSCIDHVLLEVRMPRLIRLDQTGHTVLAEWSHEDPAATDAARAALSAELERGYLAVASAAGGEATAVREIPSDADIVILRRPIAGGC